MTISTIANKVLYNGDGTTDAFTIPFLFLDNSHITAIVLVRDTMIPTTQVITTHYTLTGVGNAAGGTLTFESGSVPPSGTTVAILRDVPISQLTDDTPGDAFPAESHEDALDKLTMIAQQLSERLQRSSALAIWAAGSPPAVTVVENTENVIIGRLTSVADGSNTYAWEQVRPVNDTAVWEAVPGGQTSSTVGRGRELEGCLTLASGSIVTMFLVKDSADNTRARIQSPGTCPT